MKQVELTVSNRRERRRNAVKRLRKADKIPGIIYGKSGVYLLTIEQSSFDNLCKEVAGEAAFFSIQDETGSKKLSIIKEIQRDSLRDHVVHVDFLEVSPTEEMTLSVPLHLKGEAFGVKNERGILDVHLHAIELRCLPRHLPRFIELDITELRAHTSLYVRHLPSLEGVAYVAPPQTAVVSCVGSKAGEEKKEEKTEAAPEMQKTESA